MNDDRPWDHRTSLDGQGPEPGADDFEILLLGGDGPALSAAQAERNTELLVALGAAARDGDVVPRFVQLPAAVPAPASGTAPASGSAPMSGTALVDEGDCLRMGVRTRGAYPLGRIDFLNAVLRLAGAYRLGMYVGEYGSRAPAGSGRPPEYRQVLTRRPSVPGPDERPDPPVRAQPEPRARHRVIDLTAAVPVPALAPLDGSLMVTVVGPLDTGFGADLARIATFLDDHRVGCHAVSATVQELTVVINLVLAVLPGAPVGTGAFAEILRSGLGSDPVWPARFRPTLLDPVTTR